MTATTRNAAAREPGHNSTVWAAVGLGLLLPMVIGCWLLALSTQHGTQCVMYGDYYQDCHQGSGDVLYGFFFASVAAGVSALVLPRRWASARAGAAALQWAAQALLAFLILAFNS
ncbi:hypothetical protein [Streptomyces sp. NPDC021356]|uniref:hypothetical protein n=1 Tax=Streptomyces sp. NPDC021356 TaxID=3154900 RepID=UPI0033CFF342